MFALALSAEWKIFATGKSAPVVSKVLYGQLPTNADSRETLVFKIWIRGRPIGYGQFNIHDRQIDG